MPTMQFKCPVCKRNCRAYVDARVTLKCPGCNTLIKPHENGKVDVVVADLKPLTPPESVQVTAKSKSHDENRKPSTPSGDVESPTLQRESVKVISQETNDSPVDGFSIVYLIILAIGGISVILMGGTAIYDYFNKPKSIQTTSYITTQVPSHQQTINEPSTQIQPTSSPSNTYSSPPNNSQSSSSNGTDNAKNTVFKVYQGMYTFDTNGVIQADDFKLTISENQITYVKSETVKTFDVQYQGTIIREPQPGMQFLYHKFLLINKAKYLIVSDRKEVKHEGVSYYRIIIDGQTQLAL